MKKTFRILMIIAAGLIILSGYVNAKDFKGIITYKITYTGAELNEQMKSFLPKTMITTIKDHMSKNSLQMGMGKTITIKNGVDKTRTTLIDMMGQKYAVKHSTEDIEEELANEKMATVKITSETMDILGYSCKKAVITLEDEDGEKQDMIAWFTNDLGASGNYFDTPEFNGIDGILLKFEMINPEFTMNFTAISVEKKKVSDDEFIIPDDFQIKTQEELESLFGDQ